MRSRAAILGFRIALLIASVSVSLLIGEFMVRTFLPQPLSVPLGSDIQGISCGRPNAHGRFFVPGAFDVTVSYNSQHFRGQKEYSVEPAPGTIRIVVLGDSSTFGWGAADDHTYPAQLERMLRDRLHTNSIEVINAAFPGLGTGEEALFYDIWVKRFHPSIVILSVHVNDPSDEVRRRLFAVDSNGRAIPQHSAQERMINARRRHWREVINSIPGSAFLTQYSELFNLIRRSGSLRVEESEAPEGKANEEEYEKAGIPLVCAEITWLNQRTQESNAKLFVVLIPAREAIYDFPQSWAPFVSSRRRNTASITPALQDVCARNNIPFADLTARVLQSAQSSSQPLYYFYGFETHPNTLGYTAFAEAVAAELFDRGVVRIAELMAPETSVRKPN